MSLSSWLKKLVVRTINFVRLGVRYFAYAFCPIGTKFNIHYEDPEKLRKFEITKLPGHEDSAEILPWDAMRQFNAVFENWLVQGYYDLPRENTLNEKFPNIKTLSVKELLEQNWKGR